jgi:hypothetical protein
MTHTPGQAAGGAPEPPYCSPRCVLGQHTRCRDARPRDTGVPGVRYLICTCRCHSLSTAALAQKGEE